MTLSETQLRFYHDNGYLIIEDLFHEKEIFELKSQIKKFEKITHLPSVICEDNGDIRSIFASHASNVFFDKIYKDPRLVNPAQQLIGDDIYIYQYKVNLKKAFRGDSWEWHQDFPYWHLDDNIALLI